MSLQPPLPGERVSDDGGEIIVLWVPAQHHASAIRSCDDLRKRSPPNWRPGHRRLLTWRWTVCWQIGHCVRRGWGRRPTSSFVNSTTHTD